MRIENNESNTFNIKCAARHHGKKLIPLLYYLPGLQAQFIDTHFLIIFFKSLREMNSFNSIKLWYTVLTEGLLKS